MQFEALWERAKVDLVIQTGRNETDCFLWEHSARIAESAIQIARFPPVRAQSPNETAVAAAALYHDSAWAARVRAGEIDRSEILLRPAPSSHREQSAAFMEASLGRLLPGDSLELASKAIRQMNARDIELIEGQIVNEAENLDEFGVLSLWTGIRRGALEGKGIQAVIETWHRRKEYHFWSARLNDSFKITRVRELARRRLDSLERLMQDLEEQQRCADITPTSSAKSADRPSKSAGT
jgi:hypothetical protein